MKTAKAKRPAMNSRVKAYLKRVSETTPRDVARKFKSLLNAAPDPNKANLATMLEEANYSGKKGAQRRRLDEAFRETFMHARTNSLSVPVRTRDSMDIIAV